jgi:hypothetical protein
VIFTELRQQLEAQQARLAGQLAALEDAEVAFERLQAVFDGPVEARQVPRTAPAPSGQIVQVDKNPVRTRTCLRPGCDRTFEVVPRGGKRRFCSDSCRLAVWQAFGPLRAAATALPPLEIAAVDHLDLDSGAIVQGPESEPEQPCCAWCDEPFEPSHADQKFCGKACKTASREQRRGGSEVPGNGSPFATLRASANGA